MCGRCGASGLHLAGTVDNVCGDLAGSEAAGVDAAVADVYAFDRGDEIARDATGES